MHAILHAFIECLSLSIEAGIIVEPKISIPIQIRNRKKGWEALTTLASLYLKLMIANPIEKMAMIGKEKCPKHVTFPKKSYLHRSMEVLAVHEEPVVNWYRT